MYIILGDHTLLIQIIHYEVKLMKFVQYNINDEKERLGLYTLDERYVVDISSFKLKNTFQNMTDFIKKSTAVDLNIIKRDLERGFDEKHKMPVKDIEILSPISRPIHDIICVGVNYLSHLEEIIKSFSKSDFKRPDHTIYFSKRASKTIGPNEVIEGHFSLDKNIDYEVELAVVIGKKGKDIKKDEAWDYIFGVTIMNDISARSLQQEHQQWFRGKSLDTFTVLGPGIVHKSCLKLPLELNISSKVNGEVRQNSNTRLFIRGIGELIEEISTGITLEPGDVIATGTPAGVGMGFDPPKFLKSGDVVQCEIECIGLISNQII
jgi:2-keto-4-pentenoate hydratase/2-oxohepta-3-ene-1,7-dioic acid hydratase in catechol pathway